MATKAAKTAEETMNLSAILSAEVSKGDKDKALEEVARTVKMAERAARVERDKAEDASESAVDNYNKLIKNPAATLQQILDARRLVELSSANYSAISELYDARF